MQINDEKYCVNCYNCKVQNNQIWCKELLWVDFRDQRIRKAIIPFNELELASTYIRFGEDCFSYQSMIG